MAAIGLLLLLTSAAMAAAHPGVGIVQDRFGNVFFTDLKQVWKIAPDGQKTIAVANVHTHELYLDANGNLFGEHLWYLSETGTWKHRVWMRSPNGVVADVLPTRDGFLTDYSFVRDASGTMYWADRGAQTVIKKRLANGSIVTHATGDFRNVQKIAAMPDGTLYLMDGGDLRRIAPDGKVATVARNLSATSPTPAGVADLNYHMGVWFDAQGRVHVAVAGERLVLRIGADGRPEVVVRATAPWSISGGLVDSAGNMWLLEYDTSNEVRVRRIGRDGRERVY